MQPPLDREAIRGNIEEQLSKVKADIKMLEELVKPIAPENAIGRISRMDAINNRSVNEASLTQSRERLKKLTSALERISEKDFGICIKCRQPIPTGRIMLMPHARKCVNCS